MGNTKLVILFGIIIASGVAGVVWPYFLNLHINPFPVHAAQWHMGKGSQYAPDMTYQVSFNNTKFSADLKFLPIQNQNQTLQIQIQPSGSDKTVSQTVPIGLVYDFPNVSGDAKSYVDILDQTVFSMRDYATDDKYLAKGAEWGDLYIGANHVKLTIVDAGKMSFDFGSAQAYMLSYRIGVHENKFWVIDNLPLPVKAEVYDPEGNLEYTYELVSLNAPSTPGLSS